MIKAIFLDFDGTILSHKTGKIPLSAQKALKIIQNKGILCILATGRHILDIQRFPFENNFTFDAYITLTGQYCFNDKDVIFKNPIDKEDVRAVLHQIEEDPYPCVFVEKDRQYMNRYSDVVIEEYENLGIPLPPIEDISRALEHDIFQMSPYINRRQEEELLKRTKRVKFDRWNDDVIDVLPVGGGKNKGIEEVFKYYGIKKEQTMAVGDEANDLPMFAQVKYPVAMGNAKDIVKEAAVYTCPDIDEDGLYHAFKHFGLLDE